jgi:hypothetical protein
MIVLQVRGGGGVWKGAGGVEVTAVTLYAAVVAGVGCMGGGTRQKVPSAR